jgi:poly-gamma-glutamate synthase PgsB/CapB
MNALFYECGCLALLLVCLLLERASLARLLKRIPLRICVAGTRGKSTVTRLIAAALRESGRRVLAKTTGSKPVVIFPDGRERILRRAGPPSILEQMKILKLARSVQADAVIMEMMSIRPENLRTESGTIIRPQVLTLTNIRLDHVDDMGRRKDEIAASLAAAIPERGRMIVLEEDVYPVFRAVAEKRGAAIIPVPRDSAGDNAGGDLFPENGRLALATAEACGVSRELALRGMAKAGPDFGGAKIWKTDRAGRSWSMVSVFAANEPESSRKAISALRRRYLDLPQNMIALLNLRADRSDRTRQWLEALQGGFFDDFSHVVFIGDHAAAIGRRKKIAARAGIPVSAISDRRPQKIMDGVFSLSDTGSVVIGLGNMGGPGEGLVDYWAQIGEIV